MLKDQSATRDTFGNVLEDDASYTKSMISSKMDEGECVLKLLGVYWNFLSDELFFNFSQLVECMASLPATLLSLTAKIFDPLGILSPFVIK